MRVSMLNISPRNYANLNKYALVGFCMTFTLEDFARRPTPTNLLSSPGIIIIITCSEICGFLQDFRSVYTNRVTVVAITNYDVLEMHFSF